MSVAMSVLTPIKRAVFRQHLSGGEGSTTDLEHKERVPMTGGQARPWQFYFLPLAWWGRANHACPVVTLWGKVPVLRQVPHKVGLSVDSLTERIIHKPHL